MSWSYLKNMPRLTDEQRDTVEKHLPLIILVIKRMNIYHLERDDCIQIGTIGLMRAVQLFDETMGYAFSTYAYDWIRSAIDDELNRSLPVKVPRNEYKMRARVLAGTTYLEDPVKSRRCECIKDLLVGPSNTPEDNAYLSELSNSISNITDRLPEYRSRKGKNIPIDVRRQILIRNMLGNETQKKLADEFGVGRERVRQIRSEVKNILAEELEEYR